MIRRFAILLATLACALAGPAVAHETWLIPADGAPGHTGAVVFDLTSGGAFPMPETGPKRDRVATLTATVGGQPQPLAVGTETPTALKLNLTPKAAGLAVVAVSLGPRDIDLKPEETAEYFDEAAPSAAVLAAWKAQASGPWRETYVKNAKALVCVGERPCAGARGALKPAGAHVEFVPLEPGASPRSFRLLAAGRPLAGQQVVVIDAAHRPQRLRTDASGELRLTGPLSGWTLVAAVWLRPPATPGARFTSDFASIVFDAGG